MKIWTMEKLNSTDDLSFAIQVLQDRGKGLDRYSPLSRKLSETADTLAKIRDGDFTRQGNGGTDMNRAYLSGRLTKDPEARQKDGGEVTAWYTLAVGRESGRTGADFIRCIAFGRQAEFAMKHLRKGLAVSVMGRIRTGSYAASDGAKVYTTDIVVGWQGVLPDSGSHGAGKENSTGGGGGGVRMDGSGQGKEPVADPST